MPRKRKTPYELGHRSGIRHAEGWGEEEINGILALLDSYIEFSKEKPHYPNHQRALGRAAGFREALNAR